MKPFEEIKQEILSRTKKANACESEYRKAYESRTSEELLRLIKYNINWVLKYIHISSEYLEETFGTELLFENHIYTRGRHDISITTDSANIVCLGNSSVDVKVLDSSSISVTNYSKSSTLDYKVKGETSLIGNCTEGKIYLKKNSFEIVEL